MGKSHELNFRVRQSPSQTQRPIGPKDISPPPTVLSKLKHLPVDPTSWLTTTSPESLMTYPISLTPAAAVYSKTKIQCPLDRVKSQTSKLSVVFLYRENEFSRSKERRFIIGWGCCLAFCLRDSGKKSFALHSAQSNKA